MPVVSEPLKALVGQGQNAKDVKECTELYLANQGTEQLAGFERLVNLEVLWINDNKLVAINNLDNNIRIKQLYAHNNHICTLKGSLLHFKFLTHLDLSNNQLRDLHKLLKTFQKMHFMQELNLQGNPCCEEPDYRLFLVHAMPSLQVLDHHQVTTEERLKAAAQIGGDVAALTVAFGRRVPESPQQHSPSSETHGRSVLEVELEQTAGALRSHRQQAATDAEQALYAANPDAAYWAPHATLPPPPGVLKAQQMWAAASSASSSGRNSPNVEVTDATQQRRSESPQAGRIDRLVVTGSPSKLGNNLNIGFPTAGAASSYTPKDVIVIHGYRNRADSGRASPASPKIGAGTVAGHSPSNASSPGKGNSSARYLEGTFRQHLTDRNWEVESNSVKL